MTTKKIISSKENSEIDIAFLTTNKITFARICVNQVMLCNRKTKFIYLVLKKKQVKSIR